MYLDPQHWLFPLHKWFRYGCRSSRGRCWRPSTDSSVTTSTTWASYRTSSLRSSTPRPHIGSTCRQEAHRTKSSKFIPTVHEYRVGRWRLFVKKVLGLFQFPPLQKKKSFQFSQCDGSVSFCRIRTLLVGFTLTIKLTEPTSSNLQT